MAIIRTLLFALLFLPAQPSVAGTFSQLTPGRWVTVERVYDGDTFRTDKGEKVRLLGINTPEIAHNDSPGEEMGEQAKQFLESLVLGKRVQLVFDREKKDTYGRTLAHVYLADGSWINGQLVENGMAHLYLFAPNFAHAEALLKLEQRARSKKIGIWKTGRFKIISAAECSPALAGQFRVVTGSVSSVNRNGWGFMLGELSVTIPRSYRKLFETAPRTGKGIHVTVHGTLRVSSKGGLFLALHSPFELEIMN